MAKQPKTAHAAIRLDLDTEELSSQYHTLSDPQYKVGIALANTLNVSPNERVLDVGAGTGRLTSYIATLVGEEGYVMGIDPLKDRIDIASGQNGLSNLFFCVGDAHDLSRFDAGSFDVVYLNFVFHWLHDQLHVLRECARVLKPGGRLGLTIFPKEPLVYPFAVKERVLSAERYRDYLPNPANEMKTLTETELGALLDRSGLFSRRVISLHSEPVTEPDPETLLNLAKASAFGNFVGHLPEELQIEATKEMLEIFEARRTDQGIQFEAMVLVALAVKA